MMWAAAIAVLVLAAIGGRWALTALGWWLEDLEGRRGEWD